MWGTKPKRLTEQDLRRIRDRMRAGESRATLRREYQSYNYDDSDLTSALAFGLSFGDGLATFGDAFASSDSSGGDGSSD